MWQVKLWDERGVEGYWSEKAIFEMGLLHNQDWTANWITAPYMPSKEERYPADYFLKNVILKGDITDARLYVTACGVYKVYINGMSVTSDCLTPGFTQYEKHLQYQSYNVTDLLNKGENPLMTVLGDGWFRGNIGAYSRNNVYGTQTKLLLQLEISYVNGEKDVIVSDRSF